MYLSSQFSRMEPRFPEEFVQWLSFHSATHPKLHAISHVGVHTEFKLRDRQVDSFQPVENYTFHHNHIVAPLTLFSNTPS